MTCESKQSPLPFADDEVFVPLQAADLLSAMCRLEAGRQFHREYYEYLPLFNSLTKRSDDSSDGSMMKWVVRFFDSAELRRTVEPREKKRV